MKNGAGVLVVATTLWGFFSAGLAILGTESAGPVVAVGAAAPLLSIAAIQGQRPWREVWDRKRLYLMVGIFEGANIALYAGALALGPVPVVVALHLVSPILLILLAVLSNRRAVDLRTVVEIFLLILAIALVAVRPAGEGSRQQAVLGCALALGSAAMVTALITIVGRESDGRDPITAAGLQLVIAGMLTTPLAFTVAWDWSNVAGELVLGAVLLGPGFALYWKAMRRLSAPTAGVIGLNEALVASVVVGLVDRTQISSATIVAGLLIAAAVIVDVQNRV